MNYSKHDLLQMEHSDVLKKLRSWIHFIYSYIHTDVSSLCHMAGAK